MRDGLFLKANASLQFAGGDVSGDARNHFKATSRYRQALVGSSHCGVLGVVFALSFQHVSFRSSQRVSCVTRINVSDYI